MNKSVARNILAATLLFGGSAAAVTAAYAETEQRSPRTTQNRAQAICEGFAQEYINTRTQTTTFSTSSTTFVEMPNTRISGGGTGDVDLYTVTFSGQASAPGGGLWEIRAQVSVDGGAFVNMHPTEPDTFHSGAASQTHTMTWCREIGSASTTEFRILWRRTGGTAAVIDDFLVKVERSG